MWLCLLDTNATIPGNPPKHQTLVSEQLPDATAVPLVAQYILLRFQIFLQTGGGKPCKFVRINVHVALIHSRRDV